MKRVKSLAQTTDVDSASQIMAIAIMAPLLNILMTGVALDLFLSESSGVHGVAEACQSTALCPYMRPNLGKAVQSEDAICRGQVMGVFVATSSPMQASHGSCCGTCWDGASPSTASVIVEAPRGARRGGPEELGLAQGKRKSWLWHR